MTDMAFFIFLCLMGAVILMIAAGLSFRSWYWTKKVKQYRGIEDLTPKNPYTHGASCDCIDCIHIDRDVTR